VRHEEAQRLQALQAYCCNMVTHVRGDLLMMKARSMVLHTAQVYVDSLERRIASDVLQISKQHRGSVAPGQGDFALHRDIYYAIFHSFNSRFWALSARNMLVVLNLLWSELAWRHGTDGNFKWIGMSVTVVDQVPACLPPPSPLASRHTHTLTHTLAGCPWRDERRRHKHQEAPDVRVRLLPRGTPPPPHPHFRVLSRSP
jgi:hypothetical protein